MNQRRWSCILLVAVGFSLTLSGYAQTDEETFQEFEFNFSTPGARAAGMGRAFVGLADDATAAVTNPAGLTQLARPQAYVEYKHTNLRVRRLATDDSLSTGDVSTFYSDIDSLSFLNFSYPFADGDVVVAFTRHEFLNFKEQFQIGQQQIPETSQVLRPVNGNRDFKGVSYAGSVAVNVTDMLSIGGTVSIDRLNIAASVDRFTPANEMLAWAEMLCVTDINDVCAAGTSAGHTLLPQIPISRDPLIGATVPGEFWPTAEYTEFSSLLDEGQTGVGFSIGALVHPDERVSIGGIYSRGAKFDLDYDYLANPKQFYDYDFLTGVAITPPPGFEAGIEGDTLNLYGLGDVAEFYNGLVAQALTPLSSNKIPFNVPDRVNVGVAVSPHDRIRIVGDLNYIMYSQLVDEDFLILDKTVNEAFLEIYPDLPLNTYPEWTYEDYSIDDALEVHLGGEFEPYTGIFLRAGMFSNPEHGLRFVGDTGDDSANTVIDAVFNSRIRGTDYGLTFGGGVALGPVQIDAAYVSIDTFDEFVLSAGFEF